MSDDVKDFLQRMASEMPDLRTPGRSLRLARRAAAVTFVCSVVVVSGLGIAAFAGIRSLSAPPERTVQPPRPVSAQNGRIAFVRAGRPPITDPGEVRSTLPHVFTMNPDGSDVRQLTRGHRSIDQWPAWSPAGTKVVFSRTTTHPRSGTPGPEAVAYSLFDIEADGSGLTRLTDCPRPTCGGGGDMSPAWAPDGNRIAFISVRDGHPGLWIMNADGTGERLLREGYTFPGAAPAWSPDGSRIALVAGTAGRPRIVVVSAGTGAAISSSLIEGLGAIESASWSPDGSTLAVGAETSPGGPLSAIYLVDVSRSGGGYEARRLIECGPRCGSGDSAPAWSPDGKQIVFVRGPGAYSAGQVWVVSVSGTHERQLTDGSELDSGPAWQPLR